MKHLHKAFEVLVKESKATIYSVCLMFGSDRDEADDLFQETLVNLWKGFGHFRGESKDKTWVYRVSLNTCISYDRKKKRTRPQQEMPGGFLPDNDVAEGRQTRQLHARIQCLDPFDRAIVLLWLEDLPYDEIGAIVGISAKAVGVRLVRIREKLKKLSTESVNQN